MLGMLYSSFDCRHDGVGRGYCGEDIDGLVGKDNDAKILKRWKGAKSFHSNYVASMDVTYKIEHLGVSDHHHETLHFGGFRPMCQHR